MTGEVLSWGIPQTVAEKKLQHAYRERAYSTYIFYLFVYFVQNNFEKIITHLKKRVIVLNSCQNVLSYAGLATCKVTHIN